MERIERLKLTNNNIDLASDTVARLLAEAGVEPKDILRLKLAAEETLLKYQEALGGENIFSLKWTKRMNQLRLELSIPGECLDPFDTGEEAESEILRGILSGMGIAPAWQYKNGTNLVVFTPKKKKRSQMVTLAASIVLALLCGGLCSILPESVRRFFAEELLTPIAGTFMGFLSAVAGPMIFLSVVWGIYSIGDTATLGRIGKRMIGRFLFMSLLLTLLAGAVILPFFPLSASGGSSFKFSSLLEMILDIIPSNFFAPFVDGNPMQIIFIAVIISLAMLILSGKTTAVAAFVEQSNYMIQLIMEAVSSLVPFFIFISIFQMIIGNNFALLLESYKLLPVMLLGDLVVMAAYTALVCARKKVHPGILLKKVLPTFLIGLTTASSAAAFATNIESCEKKLGIDKRIINFGIPLGQVVFMPGAAVQFLTAGLCMAEVYGIQISPAWLVTALLITIVLAVAAPPVPGGALTCYTILFLQLNIPSEAIAITITLNVILEFAATAVNLFCLQTELVELSGSLGMLDVGKLRSRLHSSK